MIQPLEYRLYEDIRQAVDACWQIKIDFSLERPKVARFGDLSTNAAMILAKLLSQSPREIAETLIQELQKVSGALWSKIEIAEPGFINFFLTDEALLVDVGNFAHDVAQSLPRQSAAIKKINLEFISANPTGPMTLPNGRGGYMGDALANVLKTQGHDVTREYYINDAGNQIVILGKSIAAALDLIPTEDTLYQGEYIKELAWDIQKEATKLSKDQHWLKLGRLAAVRFLTTDIQPSVSDHMKIHFDIWFSEFEELHQKNKVADTLDLLRQNEVTEEREGAVWLKTTQFGDDEDRVIVKSDGSYSYFLVDIAYHLDKLHRGYSTLIDFWGADHHGHVRRMQAALKSLGYEDALDIIIMQLVTLTQAGKEVRMSKRAGNFILINDLIKEVGADVTRFFFLMYSANSHMEFDLDLAKDTSDKNPVYYVQYAHARIHSILKKVDDENINITSGDWGEESRRLALRLAEYPRLLQHIADSYEIHKLPMYVVDLAGQFHRWYAAERVIENGSARQCHIDLLKATKNILKHALDLIGVASPDSM